MIDIRPVFRQLLLSDTTVNSLVGGVRIHTVRLPQNQVEPSLVFNRVSGSADYFMDGDSGLGNVRMQLDAWAQTAGQASDLANAAYDRLSGFRGVVDSVDILGIFMANEFDGYDQTSNLYRMSRDYVIWYRSFSELSGSPSEPGMDFSDPDNSGYLVLLED